jgi:TetR/AcrR family transcriptional regulator, cholesterol catabolism regulator
VSNVRSINRATEDTTSGRIWGAAVDLFWERGYHATSMREIAERSGVQAGSLYHHYGSKEALLFEVMAAFMQELQGRVLDAVSRSIGPAERLAAAVETHVVAHGRHQREAIVTDTELRGLNGIRLERMLALRDAYETIFRQLLEDGIAAGVFDVPDPRVATKALLLQCTGVAVWYRENGRLGLDEIAAIHVALALRLAGAERPGADSDGR